MAATGITVKNDGFLWVEGGFELVDEEDRSSGLAGRAYTSLCRCGQSRNKPFCGGVDRPCHFTSQVIAFDLEPPAPKTGA